ncbi:MAG: hypothetical protein ACXU8Y_21140 [Caulobacteraceae bacterium]
MSILGRWRIIELPGYEDDYADMMEPAYILFGPTGGEFAFGCVTGTFPGRAETDAVQFSWDGNDEMDEACGDGWAELQPDGSLTGEIILHGGDEIAFTARPWATSSTAC